MTTKAIHLLYGKTGMALSVPDDAVVLEGQHVPALRNPAQEVLAALERPIGSPSLADLLKARHPKTVAVTISDITRPVPNREFLPVMLGLLNDCGVPDGRIVIVIGTGMHRPSTAQERRELLGEDILRRIEVIDHIAGDASTLVKVSDDPPVSVCRRFVQADFRIVTGFIEPHFMAGFSGGRKGVCPALVDLATVRSFHGYETLCDPRAENGNLDGNPCHRIALTVAKTVGVHFLFNVAITRDRRIAGIYCGDLEAAHETGCREVACRSAGALDGPYDLVVTNGGGYPLDATFYQTVKGMCTALPALGKHSTLLIASRCDEPLGSQEYADLMLRWNNDWQGFLDDIAANRHKTQLGQWQYQMQARVLDRIGLSKLLFVSDGVPAEVQRRLSVTPVLGPGSAQERMQRTIDDFVARNPLKPSGRRIAIIPDGPYTLLRPTI